MATMLYGVAMYKDSKNKGAKYQVTKQYLKCSRCGKIVSSVPFVSEAIVQAFIECTECISKNNKE